MDTKKKCRWISLGVMLAMIIGILPLATFVVHANGEPAVYSRYIQVFGDDFNSYSTVEDAIESGKWGMSQFATPIEFEANSEEPTDKMVMMNFGGAVGWSTSPYLHPKRSFDLKNNKAYIRFKVKNTNDMEQAYLRVVNMDEDNNIIQGSAGTLQQAGVSLLTLRRSPAKINIRSDTQRNYNTVASEWYDVMIELDFTGGSKIGKIEAHVNGTRITNYSDTFSLESLGDVDLTKIGFNFTFKSESAQAYYLDDYEIGYMPLSISSAKFYSGVNEIGVLTQNAEIKAEVLATNSSLDESKTFEMIIGLYRNGLLEDISIKQYTIQPQTIAEKCFVSIDVDDFDGAVVKSMTWEDFDTLYPLSEAAKIFAATSVHLQNIPDSVTIPVYAEGILEITPSAMVMDIEGNTITGESFIWSLGSTYADVDVNSETGVVTVGNGAQEGYIVLRATTASNPDLYAEATVELKPAVIIGTIADAMVARGDSSTSGTSNTNYGGGTTIEIRRPTGANAIHYNRKGYLKFSYAEFETVDTALLELSLAGGRGVEVQIYGLIGDPAVHNWVESNITWNNAPANDVLGPQLLMDQVYGGAPLASVTAIATGALRGVYTVDVTEYIKSLQGSNATFILIAKNGTSSSELLTSKEGATDTINGPRLVMTKTSSIDGP